jgi:hypothetical protein
VFVNDEFESMIKVVGHFTVTFQNVLVDVRTQGLPIVKEKC